MRASSRRSQRQRPSTVVFLIAALSFTSVANSGQMFYGLDVWSLATLIHSAADGRFGGLPWVAGLGLAGAWCVATLAGRGAEGVDRFSSGSGCWSANRISMNIHHPATGRRITIASSVGLPRARRRAAVANRFPTGSRMVPVIVANSTHPIQLIPSSQSMGWGLLRNNPEAAIPATVHTVGRRGRIWQHRVRHSGQPLHGGRCLGLDVGGIHIGQHPLGFLMHGGGHQIVVSPSARRCMRVFCVVGPQSRARHRLEPAGGVEVLSEGSSLSPTDTSASRPALASR